MPTLAKEYDLRDAVLLAELNLDLLIARRATGKSFKTLPAFPSIRRDVAMLVPEAVIRFKAAHPLLTVQLMPEDPIPFIRVDNPPKSFSLSVGAPPRR